MKFGYKMVLYEVLVINWGWTKNESSFYFFIFKQNNFFFAQKKIKFLLIFQSSGLKNVSHPPSDVSFQLEAIVFQDNVLFPSINHYTKYSKHTLHFHVSEFVTPSVILLKCFYLLKYNFFSLWNIQNFLYILWNFYIRYVKVNAEKEEDKLKYDINLDRGYLVQAL